MERYLRRVVVEERDLGKVVGVVRWIGWLVDGDDDNEGASEGVKAWRGALESIKENVQSAVQERGLGKLDLG
jgi:DNA repair protein REV1